VLDKILKLICVVTGIFILYVGFIQPESKKVPTQPRIKLVRDFRVIKDTITSGITKVDTIYKNTTTFDTIVVVKGDTAKYSGTKIFKNEFYEKTEDKETTVSFSLKLNSTINTFLSKSDSVYIQRKLSYRIDNLKVRTEISPKLFRIKTGMSFGVVDKSIDMGLRLGVEYKEKYTFGVSKSFNTTFLEIGYLW